MAIVIGDEGLNSLDVPVECGVLEARQRFDEDEETGSLVAATVLVRDAEVRQTEFVVEDFDVELGGQGNADEEREGGA